MDNKIEELTIEDFFKKFANLPFSKRKKTLINTYFALRSLLSYKRQIETDIEQKLRIAQYYFKNHLK